MIFSGSMVLVVMINGMNTGMWSSLEIGAMVLKMIDMDWDRQEDHTTRHSFDHKLVLSPKERMETLMKHYYGEMMM